ncbi:hypothetical protein [Streptomyces sp. NPDC020681]|uniref:hypothetical protein n=1 Tax=Streptomyces sp. NPDC020681 TaxID=3365083 RepID=UPI00378DAF2E
MPSTAAALSYMLWGGGGKPWRLVQKRYVCGATWWRRSRTPTPLVSLALCTVTGSSWMRWRGGEKL